MIWSALILGVAGSLHCLAMCGPLVVTINQHRSQSALDQIYYHGARVLVYMLMGALAATFGMGIKFTSSQQILSIATGFLLIAGLLISWRGVSGQWAKVVLRIKTYVGNMAGNRMVWLGMVNGLLPCGLTYVALAAALSTADVLQGVKYMALFGLGTTPALWLIVKSLSVIPASWRSSRSIVIGCTWVLAVLLILRGLELGVPYLSPEFQSTEAAVMTICN